MKCFSTSTIIHASPNDIWNILVDGTNWLQWNPTITKIEGNIALGETLKIHKRINPNQSFPFKVSEFIPYEKMVWTGGSHLNSLKAIAPIVCLSGWMDV